MPAGDQLVAQLQVIEDFAVERNNYGAVRIGHRLLARRKVDDRKPCMAKPDPIAYDDTPGIGPAVADRIDHG